MKVKSTEKKDTNAELPIKNEQIWMKKKQIKNELDLNRNSEKVRINNN